MTKHGMLDLETAGTGPNAAILTIGFLMFDPLGDPAEDTGYHWVVPFEKNGRANVDLNTIQWWMRQSPEARATAWDGARDGIDRDNYTPMANLPGMFDYVDHIWANDPDFDCVILRSYYERLGIRWPWYRKHRSMRTLKALFGTPEVGQPLVAHNALDDCKYQAAQVRAIVKQNNLTFGEL